MDSRGPHRRGRQEPVQGFVDLRCATIQELFKIETLSRRAGGVFPCWHARFLLRHTPARRKTDLTFLILRLPLEPLNLSTHCITWDKALNAELAKKALEKVGNPNVLVNLISRRVRQLNSGAGALGRPLVAETGNMGAADIALLEIIEEKVGFEMPELAELTRPVGKKRKKH